MGVEMLPAGFSEKYTRLLGTQAPAFLASFDAPAYSGFRINPLRQPAPTVNAAPVPWSPWGYYGKVAGNGIDHVAGLVYGQEPSAQFVGTVAAPKPGERVLDLCAAPGGKTTQLASYLGDTGVLVANEINPGRAKILASNVERFGLRNVVVTNSDPATLAAQWPGVFDRILVDAPCSGEGMFRKDPAAMQYWTPAYPAECARRQREILTEAVKMLRPGGTLVYSTCTFAPEEDEQIAAWATANLGLTLQPIDRVAGIAPGRPEFAAGAADLALTARLWPHLVAGEGHFVAKFQKAAGDAPRVKLAQPRVVGRAEAALVTAWWQDTLQVPLPAGTMYAVRDQVFVLPVGTPAWDHIRVIRGGLHLGTLKKNRFEGSHSLATAYPAASFRHVVAVTPAEYASYRHGETLQRATALKAWVLLALDEKGFALGKQVNGTIKNAYPKGLRV